MQIQNIIDDFYKDHKNSEESNQDLIKIDYSGNFIEIDVRKLNRDYPNFINLFISEFNKGMGMPGIYKPELQKITYKKNKSKIILSKIYNKFHTNYLLCNNCKLRYLKLENNQIICTACGFIKNV